MNNGQQASFVNAEEATAAFAEHRVKQFTALLNFADNMVTQILVQQSSLGNEAAGIIRNKLLKAVALLEREGADEIPNS